MPQKLSSEHYGSVYLDTKSEVDYLRKRRDRSRKAAREAYGDFTSSISYYPSNISSSYVEEKRQSYGGKQKTKQTEPIPDFTKDTVQHQLAIQPLKEKGKDVTFVQRRSRNVYTVDGIKVLHMKAKRLTRKSTQSLRRMLTALSQL